MAGGFVRARDGQQIAYEMDGQGSPALLFVHGWSCDRSYWHHQLKVFASHCSVVALDLAGHGESDRTREHWTIEGFGGDVASLVEALGLSRPILIGHSMGGDVVVAAAVQLPGRVAGLVWVDAYRKLGTPRTPDERARFLAPFRTDFANTTRAFVASMFSPDANPGLVARVADRMASAPPGIALPCLEAAFSYDAEIPGALQRLGLEVVAINPGEPASDIASLERYGVSTLTMEGVGHFPMLEKPEEFNATLRAAIARLQT